MKPKDFRYNGKRALELAKAPTSAEDGVSRMKDELINRTEENIERMIELQQRLYADGREGLIILIQGIDAAGKDSLIKHITSGMNPQGVRVYPFKAPTSAELSHDYLWRVAACLPSRGYITIFNRSHYEDVVTVAVNKLYEKFHMPERCLGEGLIDTRLKQIRHFEDYLYENGIRMVKIFLNLSKDEQKKRMLERLDRPEKNWKFESGDLDTREKWDKTMQSYESAINATATKRCPWYVLPADNKWFTRYLATEAVLDALERINPQYPELSPEETAALPEYKKKLGEV